MPFRIGDHIIPFDDSEQLSEYQETHPITKDLIPLVRQWVEGNDLHAYTSGSTGSPKLIKLPRASVIKSAELTLQYFDIFSIDTMLLAMPVTHIAGMMMVIRSIIADCTLYIMQPHSRLSIPISKIKFTALTPHQFISSYNTDRKNFDRIEKVLLGGAPANLECERIAEAIKAEVYHGYGMTETITHIAMRRIASDHSRSYRGMHGVRFSLNDSGCLRINADHLSEPVETSDIAELIDNKEFNWKGRRDNVINSGGIKIHPEKIEQILSQLLETECLIIPRTDPTLGSRIALVVEGAYNILELNKKELTQLTKYEIPKEFTYLKIFDKTTSGKIDRLKNTEKAIRNNTFERLLFRE